MRKRKVVKRFSLISFCLAFTALLACGAFFVLPKVNAQSSTENIINTYNSKEETRAVSDDEIEKFYELEDSKDGVTITPSWQYLDKTTGGFVNLPSDKKLNINDTLQLTVNYTHVAKSNITSHNNTIRYKMPEELSFVDSGWRDFYSQNDSTKKAGEIAVKDGYVYIRYEDSWMDEIQDNDVLGAFMAQGTIDISKVDKDGIVKIVLGDEQKELQFDTEGEPDNAPISVQKDCSDENKTGDVANRLIEENGKYYLDYDLTVMVQGDSSKTYDNVQVSDSFINTKYIKEYSNITGEKKKLDNTPNDIHLYGDTGYVYLGKAGSSTDSTKYVPAGNDTSSVMVWDLGTVQGGSSYQLHYRVEIKDSYIGVATKSKDDVVIENRADAWYRKYSMQKDVRAVFTPKGEVNVNKHAVDSDGNIIEGNDVVQKDEDGNLFIYYSVDVSAPEDNTWNFSDIYFTDSLYGNDSQTPKYLSFVKSSFKVNGVKVDEKDLSISNTFVRFNIGDFAPNTTKTVTYKVKIDPGIYTYKTADSIVIRNTSTAQIRTSSTSYDTISQSSCTKTIANKKWARKLTDGIQTADDQTINMNGNDIKIPKGSFKYQVVVNEKGDWNVNKSDFKDKISNADYMQYVGLLKVDAYDISDVNMSGSTDAEVANSIASSKLPDATGWVNIDGKSQFNITPDKVLSSEKNYDSSKTYAYVLTYYTKTSPTLTEIRVQNRFYLEGGAGWHGHIYDIVFSDFSVDVNIAGSSSYSTSKTGWYYNKTDKKLYWIIQLKPGDYPMTLPTGFTIKDTPLLDTSGSHMDHVTNDTRVSVLKGTMNPSKFDSYDNALNSNRYTSVAFTKKIQTNSVYGKWNEELISLDENVNLDTDESLYVLVETNPSNDDKSLSTDRSYINYRNQCAFSSDGSSWSSAITSNYMIAGRDNMIKELEMSFTKSGDTYNMLYQKDRAYTEQKIIKSMTKENGTYYTWGLVINYEGSLSGDAVIEDEIPEGLELAYVQYYWCGIGYNANTRPAVAAYDADGWTKVDGYNKYGSTVSYSVKGNKIRWKVSKLKNSQGSGKFDRTAVQFHVTCRVKDKQTLMGGNNVKFTNNSTIYQNGIVKGEGTNTVTYSGKSISKVIDSESLSGDFVNFSIDLNALAEDLDTDSDRLILVDELKSPLYFDTDSVKLYESDGITEYTGQWNVSYDYSESGKQIMRVNVPDNTHLILKYRAGINARQGYIQINNVAHWEGYKSPQNADIKNEQFTYTVSAVAGSSLVPKIQIKKMDASNSAKLSGAEFKIVASKAYGEDSFTDLKTPLTGTTDENGSLVFGSGSDKLDVNTIYKIVETKAPSGYVLDSTPQYAVVIGKLSDDSTPEFGGTVTDNGKEYPLNTSYTDTVQLNLLNSRPELTFSKHFTDSFGSEAVPVQNQDGTWSLKEDDRKVTRFDGTYTFALNDGNKDIQWIRFIVHDGDIAIYKKDSTGSDYYAVSEMCFSALSADKTYSIWELDSSGNHLISNQSFESGEANMMVSYKDCDKIDVSKLDSDNVPVVVNSKITGVFPNTGGKGWYVGCCIGLMVMLFAVNKKGKR